MEILYEDNHLIAVNKSEPIPVQQDPSGDEPLEDKVKKYIAERYKKKGNVFLGIVHRIDRPVTGVVLFARTSKALERMNKLFAGREVTKLYWAIVKNAPPADEGVLEHYILRNSKQNKSYAHEHAVPGSKPARLRYKVLARSDRYYLIEIDLETGRHHQIRCQLAKIGCPVKGDLKYGAERSNPDSGISLHARSLSFVHPVAGTRMEIIAPPPADPLWDYFLRTLK